MKVQRLMDEGSNEVVDERKYTLALGRVRVVIYVFISKIARACFSENGVIEMRLERKEEQNCCMK